MGKLNWSDYLLWYIIFFLCNGLLVNGQEESSCYGPGSITIAVVLTLITTIILVALLYHWWQKRKSRNNQLILETDPERAKDEYAFDNPGFKDATLIPVDTLKKSKLETSLPKWNQWSPLNVLGKSDKRKTLDDTALEENEVKVVALRSHDFTGLGFNICGNIKEGIFIKDILHRGPAFESGKLNPGDKINSVTINFEHMVCEDALTILSYASPYEVIIEAKSGKGVHCESVQGAQLGHPVYRSSSCTDIYGNDKASRKGLTPEYTNYSSLQKSKSNMTTLERKRSKSPKPSLLPQKNPLKHLSPKNLKSQLEQKILPDHHNHAKPAKAEAEVQKTENKYQKLGIKVLPSNLQLQKSPKSAEQNDNNINIEKNSNQGVDEVDDKKPVVKKREKKMEPSPEKTEEGFVRNDLNGSGLKRDKNGIPQEIPSHMLNAAVAARNNRKSAVESQASVLNEEDDGQHTKKAKGKAPSPPEEKPSSKYDEIETLDEAEPDIITSSSDKTKYFKNPQEESLNSFNSDSDAEDTHSSVNTIELKSNEITVHQGEDEKIQNRKTASTGDLTKIEKTRTLERAQSLDITESGTLKRKGSNLDEEEELLGKVMLNKAPRLSLIINSLNTFERNNLKKSTEWGNLEDAIIKLNQEEMELVEDSKHFDFGEKSPEFDALVKKINEIKQEAKSKDVEEQVSNLPCVQNVVTKKKAKNQIWPSFNEITTQTDTISVKLDQPKINGEHMDSEELKVEEKPQSHNNVTPVIPERRRIAEKNNSQVNISEKAFEKSAITIKYDLNDSKSEASQCLPKEVVKNPPQVAKEFNSRETTISVVPSLETSSVSTTQPKYSPIYAHHSADLTDYTMNPINSTEDFLYTEKLHSGAGHYAFNTPKDVNVSDDMKVSMHSYESLERNKTDSLPDDAKTEHSLKLNSNISNVTVNNGDSELHSLELSVNDNSELYMTALDGTIESTVKKQINNSPVIKVVTPDPMRSSSLVEGDSDVTDSTIRLEESLLKDMSDSCKQNNNVTIQSGKCDTKKIASPEDSENTSLTYVTEIKVTQNNNNSNVSEIEILPTLGGNESVSRNLDKEFENYLKTFDGSFEPSVPNFEINLEELIKEPPKTMVKNEGNDAEKEMHKIKEIAEEQLKKLPEMRFVTTSYESPNKTPEKLVNQSHIELLRMNFEKVSPKANKPDSVKSRIPVATTAKSPPISPERRDSKSSEPENDRAILELMSSTAHSTPLPPPSKYQIKPPSKNISVTSIRNNSKIPSGLPTLAGGRHYTSPRKSDLCDNDSISTNESNDSVVQQWMFNASNNSVTNISLTDNSHKS